MADSQVAQFFIPKTTANKDKLITDNEYRQILAGQKGWQGQKTAMATAIAQKERIFHWFLEFPEVFQKEGFDCILGNPPFLGGQKLSGSFGDAYLEYIKYQFKPIGAVDLVTYFFRRIYTIINKHGFLSLISTNTIAQGKSREEGLDIIVRQGGTINHAVKSMKWPGIAAVEIALVTITKQIWKGSYVLSGNEVKTITPYLDDAETLGNPFSLIQNENKSFQGSIVLGNGFVLEPPEAEALINKDPKNKEVLFPYMNGNDLNNNPDQSPSRWVINFFDWPEEKAKLYTDCYNIVEKLVKPERQRWAIDKNDVEIIGEYALRKPLPEKWWIYGEKRPALYKTISNLKRVLLIPNQACKYVALQFVQSKMVFSNALAVYAQDDYYFFAIVSSCIHVEWAWKNASRMKADMRYTPSDVFENFPFPQNLSSEKEQEIEQLGEHYHEHRKQLMLLIQLGLTKTYNLFHAKDLSIESIEKACKQTEVTCKKAYTDILKLRVLQKQMDEAVLETYGWSNIQMRHDFYEVDYLPENDRVRYTIHPDARKEVLKRLLELNHTIYEEEIKQGLHKEEDVTKFYEQKGIPVPAEVIAIMGANKIEKKAKEYKKSKKSIANNGQDNLFSGADE